MSRISNNLLETYFEYGIDIKNRCIFLHGEITEESSVNIIKGLYLMDHENHDPIELRICSPGGDIYEMFGIHDVTRTLFSPVHTVGIGRVMSAAVLLVACGEKGQRWAGPNTSFMVHVPSWQMENTTLHNHKIESVEVDRMWERWYDLMGNYTNQNAVFWKRICNKKVDVYFDAQAALEYGIIDEIWNQKD